MKIEMIELENLSLSKTSVRKVGAKDIQDLILSIKSLGVLQPLLVREHKDQYSQLETRIYILLSC